MLDSMNFSSRGAFSYRWNKGVDSGEFCLVRLVKSVACFCKGFFGGGYAVSVVDIELLLTNNDHNDSIFAKEHDKELKFRKTDIVSEIVSGENEINNEELKSINYGKKKEPVDEKQKHLDVKNDEVTENEDDSVQDSLYNELWNFRSARKFNACNDSEIESIKKKLNLLNVNYSLLLFNIALNKEITNTGFARLILENTKCHKMFGTLSKNERKNALTFFAECGFVKHLEEFFEHGTHDINERSAGGYAPLQVAVLRGNEECVKLLLEKGAEVNVSDDNGYTPLHLAAKEGNKKCLELLLNGKADVNISNKFDNLPLCLAVLEGGVEGVKVLLAAENARYNKEYIDRLISVSKERRNRDDEPEAIETCYKELNNYKEKMTIEQSA